MSDTVFVTAIISPAPGKEARVQEFLEAIVKGTQANEANTSKYHVNKAVDSTDFIVIEAYNTYGDFEAHTKADYFQSFVKAIEAEGLLSQPPKIVPSKKLFGFESR